MEKINDIVMIKMDEIVPNPNQPRTIFDSDALNALASSIKAYGILQPISVKPLQNGYELIMGERRFRAAQLIGLKKIPAIIIDVSIQDSAVVALIENLQRVDLNFLEEAESYKKLIDEYNYKQSDLAERIGKSQSTISNKMRLLSLDEAVRDVLSSSNLTERHGRSLLKLKNQTLQLKAVNHVAKLQLNVKDTEKYITKLLNSHKKISQQASFKVSHRIYLNTIKKSFKMIQEMENEASMEMDEFDNYVEIKIRIPKK
jgi:ParB family chromosome partitioning protein